MFFENDLLLVKILDVLEFDQTNVRMENRGRNYNALSFRFRSDATLTDREGEYHASGNSVCYVPARVDYRREATMDQLIVIHFETVNYSAQHIECFIPRDPVPFESLFRRILMCWKEKKPGFLYKCSALFYEILEQCYEQNYVVKASDSKIRRSVKYLLEHFRESELSMREIASKSYMSEVYFRKLFKREFGISPQKYIINLRIQYAKGLIATGYCSLKEVAYLSGYGDYKYFLLEFKRIVGVSPSKYLYNS